MANAELKTKRNNESVEKFLKSVENKKRREDSFEILGLMKNITKEEPKMWGDSIVGFGEFHYKYKTGREGDWFLVGFSPRKANLTLYIMSGFKEYNELLKQLGKYKTSVSCLYVKDLEDVDMNILKKLITLSVKEMKAKR